MAAHRRLLFLLFLHLTPTTLPGTPLHPCHPDDTIEITNPRHLPDGGVLDDDGNHYLEGRYWEESSSEGAVVVRGCDMCTIKNCVRKCCPQGQLFSAESATCVPKDDPSFEHPLPSHVVEVHNHESFSHLHVLYGIPCNGLFFRIGDEPGETFYITDNGTLIFQGAGFKDSIPHTKYCLEIEHGSSKDSKITGFVCFEAAFEDVPEKPEEFPVYAICMLVSEPFLVATFLVYGLIRELRNVHGKCLMSHVSALFIGYLFLAIMQLSGRQLIGTAFCVVAAFITYFAFLASFFWLNVLSFDLFWSFSGYRPLRDASYARDQKRFLSYSLYAWGAPLVMFFVTLVMNRATSIPEHVIKPQIGDHSCWFKENDATWAYFYGPVAAILVFNLNMFLKMLWTILRSRTNYEQPEMEENNLRFSLYLKLFIVMGINWWLEVISFSVGQPSSIFSYIADVGNTLQGILIFVIFVCNKKVLRLIVDKCSGNTAERVDSNTAPVLSEVAKSPGENDASADLGCFNLLPVIAGEIEGGLP